VIEGADRVIFAWGIKMMLPDNRADCHSVISVGSRKLYEQSLKTSKSAPADFCCLIQSSNGKGGTFGVQLHRVDISKQF